MLAQKLVLSYGSKIAIQFVQIIASIVVARIAGPTVLGTVAFGLAFVSMFSFFSDLGIGSAHVKLVSEGQNLGKCISTFARLKLINTSLFFIIVISVFLVQKYFLGVQFESTAHEYVIMIMLVTVTINQVLNIPLRTFAARTEQAKQDVPDFVRTLLYQVLRIFIVILGYRAVALAFGNLISTLLVIPLIVYLFRSYPRDRFDRSLAYKYLRMSLPIFIMGMSTSVIYYLDKVFLQYFTNSEQVGLYMAGFRIGAVVFMIANSVGVLFFPTFSKAAANGDFPYIKSTIEKFERFSYLFVMPAVILLSLYSDVIIAVLLGRQYLPSIPVMAIINLATFLVVVSVTYGNVLAGMGYFKLSAILNLVNLALFIMLMCVFVHPGLLGLGPIGAAVAVFVSDLFLGFSYRHFAKQKCPILDLRRSAKYMLFGIANFCCFYLLYANFSNVYGGLSKAFFVVFYLCITYVSLLLLGLMEKSDFRMVRQIVDVRKIGSYIKREIQEK